MQSCRQIVKQMTEFLPSDISAQISRPSNCYFFLPLLCQTPVNKPESFNVRSKGSERAKEAMLNLRVTRSSYFSTLLTVYSWVVT